DFKRGFEINSLFDRGNLKGPEGLRGTLKYRDPQSGREQKYTITARLVDTARLDSADRVAYELVPTMDFRASVRNIFHAMLTVLQFRIAKCVSPQHKAEVESQFKAFVDGQRNETRFGAFDKTLDLLTDLDKRAFAEPGKTEADPERGALIFNMLDKICKEVKDFAACRTPEHSIDVVTRMEQKHYKG
ncbi:hypothetical protein, partial [Burkholderia sp. Bp8986]|uniref:hypothetical protein n=1 Tax=Burkholderia sp. Bp8986 TaxID=2184550 RepID=UPI000F9A0599